MIVQPENRGTGIAVARAMLTMLLERDANAVVAVCPCDHHYEDEQAFLKAVEAGILAVENKPDAIVLLGADPTYAETDYGWIEPLNRFTSGSGLSAAPVVRFWEKPPQATAQELLRRGCLWNTFVAIGRVSTFIDMLCECVPKAILALTAGIRAGDLNASYRLVPMVDFSRDVLASQTERLLVIRDAESGWTDLGSIRRVFDILARQKIAPSWLESLRDVDMPTAV